MSENSNKDDQSKELTTAKLTNQLLSNPQVLAAFNNQLQGMVGKNSGYIQTLPKEVKKRIKALKKIQLDIFNVETKFYEDIHALECKYAEMYKPYFDKRSLIVNAQYEPTEEECDWKSDNDDVDDQETDTTDKKTILNGDVKEAESPKDANVTGIPEFWLTIFKNVEMIAVRIQDHDEPILKHLLDIRVKYSSPENMGFTLEFHFSSNDFFSNEVLTKEYKMRSPPDPDCPLSYDGPEIIKCTGCKIDWKAGKNVTVKNVKKKIKGKSGPKKMVTKTVKAESFFNFFSPPEADSDKAHPDDDDEENDIEHELMTDYEIGQLLQTSIIPRAILYFTGEALDDDDDEDDDGDEDDDVDDEDDDKDDENSDEDKDYSPTKNGKAGNGKVPDKECKQQ